MNHLKRTIALITVCFILTVSCLAEPQKTTKTKPVVKKYSISESFGLERAKNFALKIYRNKGLIGYALIVSPLFYMYNKVLIDLVFKSYLKKDAQK